MSYTPNLPVAAGRHLAAAEELAGGTCRRVAGYLYGIAAECAIKAMMLQVGLTPLPGEQRRADPFYAHFPELRTLLRDRLAGRRDALLLRFIKDDSFLHHWDTEMRYCAGAEIQDSWITDWQTHARNAHAAMGT